MSIYIAMASIRDSFDLRNPYTASGMGGGQPSVFSQSVTQLPTHSTPQPIPSEPDFHTSGATDYSISSNSSVASRIQTSNAYPLQQLMQQTTAKSSITNDVNCRKSAQPDFLSDLSGFVVGNGVGSSEFVTSPSLQAAAALAAHHRNQQQQNHHYHLYRPFSTDAPSPPPGGRLRSPPFGSTGPPRNSNGMEGEQSLGDSRSLGALLREIAGVPNTTTTSPAGHMTSSSLRQVIRGAGAGVGHSPPGRMMDAPRYESSGIPNFSGKSLIV